MNLQSTLASVLGLVSFASSFLSAQALPPDPEADIKHLSGDYYALMWQGHVGNTYFIQASTGETSSGELVWEYVPDIRYGIGQPIGMGFEVLGDPTKRFYRLQYTNQPVVIDHNLDDNDGDGFTNLEEILANTDPEDPLSYPSSNDGGGSGSSSGGSGEGDSTSDDDDKVILIHTIDGVSTTYHFTEGDKVPRFNIDRTFGVLNELIMVKAPKNYELPYLKLMPNEDYDPTAANDPNVSADAPENSKYFAEAVTLKGNVLWSHKGTLEYSNSKGKLLPLAVIPDYNRDGKITSKDRHRVNSKNPWRWWINDDKDFPFEEIRDQGSDIPSTSSVFGDFSNNWIDGMRDLVDFFPLHLELGWVLNELPQSEYDYFLKHSEGALKFYEEEETILNADENNQGPAAYLRNLDKARSLSVKIKMLQHATNSGVQLGGGILTAFDNGKGVLICEAAKETDAPLILEIKEKDGTAVVEIEFPVKFSGVEKMFRHGNMRSTAGGSGGPDSRLGDPGDPYPDELTNGKYFVYLHGFKVDAESARGWHAEMFKRLHQTGSRNRFYGITWYGDTTNAVGIPNYYEGVLNAFLTSKALPGWLQVGGAEITIAAHSLGNMVVSNAIEHEDHNGNPFTPENYFMINAATPIEAYDASQTTGADGTVMAPRMTENQWKPYDRKLFASDWHKMFSAPDGREKLRWPNRFANRVPQLAYNFYSTGEDVVENPDETESAGGNILVHGFARHAWVQNEVSKGTDAAESLFSETHAGWKKFLGAHPPHLAFGYGVYSPSELSSLYDDNLEFFRYRPYHERFKFSKLYDPLLGSAEGNKKQVQFELLAASIPAMSYAAAANPIEELNPEQGLDRNFNMMAQKNGGWPRDSGDWLHSDYYDVAYSYVYPMYREMTIQGNLDDE